MTERITSKDESGFAQECLSLDLTTSSTNSPRKNSAKSLNPSIDFYHLPYGNENQPLEEKSKCAQNRNFTNVPPNVEQILPQSTNTNSRPLQGSEGNYNDWIQSNELAEENVTHLQYADSSLANFAVNYLYCPSCSFKSVDRSQIANHFHAFHEENTNSTNFQVVSHGRCSTSNIDGVMKLKSSRVLEKELGLTQTSAAKYLQL
nr:hypothetical transcript [Hymenolepis microstoma]